MKRSARSLLVASALVLSGCAGTDAAPSDPSNHRPTYAAEPGSKPAKPRARHKPRAAPSASAVTRAATPGATATPGGSGVGSTGGSETPGSATAASPTTHGSVSDVRGDERHAALSTPPGYADLTAAELTRSDAGLLLRVSATAAFPTRQVDADRTENVVFYADVDGDGKVDYEIWASLADNGWGTSFFDNANGDAYYGDNSGVSASVSGSDLVVTFTLGHLAGADRFRWSIGAEWGTYTEVQAGSTSYDAAPDTGAAAFPQ